MGSLVQPLQSSVEAISKWLREDLRAAKIDYNLNLDWVVVEVSVGDMERAMPGDMLLLVEFCYLRPYTYRYSDRPCFNVISVGLAMQ
tara:strand:- start:122 stop:382 length:261 start_codon:yes stop_codon:yes gene_type:complete